MSLSLLPSASSFGASPVCYQCVVEKQAHAARLSAALFLLYADKQPFFFPRKFFFSRKKKISQEFFFPRKFLGSSAAGGHDLVSGAVPSDCFSPRDVLKGGCVPLGDKTLPFLWRWGRAGRHQRELWSLGSSHKSRCLCKSPAEGGGAALPAPGAVLNWTHVCGLAA